MPAEPGRANRVLWHRQQRQRAAQRLPIGSERVEPGLDLRGDPLTDLHAGQRFVGDAGFHLGIDMREPGRDHVDCPARKSEGGDVWIDALGFRRRQDSGLIPAIERSIFCKPRREAAANFV